MSMDRIVISDIGTVSALGTGYPTLRENLGTKPHTDTVQEYEFHSLENEVPVFPARDFDPVAVLGKKGLRTKDWATKLILGALEQIKHVFETSSEENRPGLCIGTSFGSVQSIGDFLSDSIVNGVNKVNPMAFANTVINSPTGNANIRYGVKTMSTTVSTGFNAGMDAVITSCDYIRSGYLPAVVAGGLEEVGYYELLGLQRTGILSPTGKMLPLGKAGDGLVMGEGAGVFMLETAGNAHERGAKPVVEIAGYCTAFDPSAIGFTHSTEAAKYTMKKACAEAGISTGNVGLVVSGANGMTSGDAVEAAAVSNVFGNTPVAAYKSWFGECYGASGALSIACAIADMTGNRITGQPEAYEHIECINLVKKTTTANVENVVVNSFSCDGHCSSIILRRLD